MTADQILNKMGLSDVAVQAVTGKQFNGVIHYEEIKSKDRVSYGVKYPGQAIKGHKADIMPDNYILIYGMEFNHVNGPVTFNKTFNIGDNAEYDSYNLSYVGKITAIKAKYIEITAYGTTKHRLDIYSFSWRNWDFDLEKIRKEIQNGVTNANP
uniref:Uncharacterized protein n=1 Tax=viral metagenome TaxID=1070528 RepID=A0A6M3L970_9ZZZZ